jgi:hypothetical protein
MAIIVIRTKYVAEADQLENLLKDRDVTITPEARKLLRLTVQGWHEEPPEFRDSAMQDQEKLKSLLSMIVDDATKEEHVLAKRAQGKPVAFSDLFEGLAKAGRRVVRDYVLKGFSSEEA